MKNYYQILGLEQNCNNEQIKSAFKEYAKHYHPDKHQGNAFFADKFIEVKEAYDNLIDYKIRKTHDEFHNFNQTHQNKSNSNNQQYHSPDQQTRYSTNREDNNAEGKATTNSSSLKNDTQQRAISDAWGYPIFFFIGVVLVCVLAAVLDNLGITDNLAKRAFDTNLSNMWPLILGGVIGMIWYHFQDS